MPPPTLTKMPSFVSTSWFSLISHTLQADARLQLPLLFVTCMLLVLVACLMTEHHDHEADNHERFEGLYQDIVWYTKDKARMRNNFYHAILFTLTVSMPAVLDVLLYGGLVLLRRRNAANNVSISKLYTPAEFTRRYILFIVTIPNVLVYFQVIPAHMVDLVIFYQYVCIFLVMIYRVHTLSSSQKFVTGIVYREIAVFNVLACFFGFLYKLAVHKVVVGAVVFKSCFTICLVVGQSIALVKVIWWYRASRRLASSLQQSLPGGGSGAETPSSKVPYASLIVGILAMSSLAVIHLVTFTKDYIFFPSQLETFIAFEWVFGGIVLLWTAVRNLEVRKSELQLEGQLDYNRKMTRSISHEIRTPLNTAFMALELLMSTLNTPSFYAETQEKMKKELVGMVESVREGCDISLSILNQLLTFEKLRSGMMQLETKLITVEQLLDSNMKLFKMQAQQMGVNLKLQSQGQEIDRVTVFVDEHKMNQVIRNLLSNAMKFTPKGGNVTVELTWYEAEERSEKVHVYQSATADLSTKRSSVSSTSTEAEKSQFLRDDKTQDIEAQMDRCHPATYRRFVKSDHRKSMPRRLMHETVAGAKAHGILLLSIIDSGPGVSKEDQKKLFNEYVQIRPGALQKGQGTGLGLSISKSIVLLHGGNIGMFSDGQGHGSTFFIELPAYRCQMTPHLQRDSSSVSMVSKMSAPHFIPSSLSRAATRRVLPISRANSAVLNPQGDDHHLLASKSRSKYSKSKSKSNILKQQISVQSNLSNSLQLSDADDNEVFVVDRADSLTLVPHDIQESSMVTMGQETDDEINAILECPTNCESLSDKQSDFPAPSSGLSLASVVNTRGSILVAPKTYHILVVDDSFPNRKLLSRLLQREGHVITEADDGTTAVKLIQQMIEDEMASMKEALSQQLSSATPFSSLNLGAPPHNDDDPSTNEASCIRTPMKSFDFVLLDFHMTHMDGPETAMQLRKLGYTGPIIGVTGVMDEDSNDFINHGADIVLCKPIKIQMIWKALHSLLFL